MNTEYAYEKIFNLKYIDTFEYINIVIKMKNSDTKYCCDIDLDALKGINEILPEIEDEEKMNRLVMVLKALSDPTRLQILYLLRNTDLCVCEMVSLLKKPQSTLSHHLSILKAAELIKPRKKGIWIYYTFLNPEVRKFLDFLNLNNTPKKMEMIK